jgi:acetolactate synthase-1/2/3 large subunit
MNGQELATAMAHGAKKLLSIVVDNGTYGTIRMHQEREYPAGSRAATSAIPDFAGAGARLRLVGGRAGRPHRPTFEPALEAALAADRPALIHLRLDADVITSRTTLRAIRAAAEKRAAGA